MLWKTKNFFYSAYFKMMFISFFISIKNEFRERFFSFVRLSLATCGFKSVNKVLHQIIYFIVGRFHAFISHEGPQVEQSFSSTLFQTSALEGGEGSASIPAATYPQERPGTHCTGGWVGLRAGLDRCGKSRPRRDQIPGPSSPQAVAIPTELP